MADIKDQPNQDLQGEAAIKKLQEIAKGTNICLLHTGLADFPNDCSPMALQDAD